MCNSAIHAILSLIFLPKYLYMSFIFVPLRQVWRSEENTINMNDDNEWHRRKVGSDTPAACANSDLSFDLYAIFLLVLLF